jgi:hypothetical protein
MSNEKFSVINLIRFYESAQQQHGFLMNESISVIVEETIKALKRLNELEKK